MGGGPSQTHGLSSPCHVAWAFQPMSGRRAEGGGLAHGTHGTHGRIFDRRERSDRRTEIGRKEAQDAQESVG